MKAELRAAVKAIDAEIAKLSKLRDSVVESMSGESPHPRKSGPKQKKKKGPRWTKAQREAHGKKVRAAIWKKRKAAKKKPARQSKGATS